MIFKIFLYFLLFWLVLLLIGRIALSIILRNFRRQFEDNQQGQSQDDVIISEKDNSTDSVQEADFEEIN